MLISLWILIMRAIFIILACSVVRGKSQDAEYSCYSSATCRKGDQTEQDWLKIYPRPACSSKDSSATSGELEREERKFNDSIKRFFENLKSIAVNKCQRCSSYGGIGDNRESYSDNEECFSPVVCSSEGGETVTDYIRIRPFPYCKYDEESRSTLENKTGTLFNRSMRLVVEELRNLLFGSCRFCLSYELERVIADISRYKWLPSKGPKTCYAPVICSAGEESFENWMRYPDPLCNSSNMMSLNERPSNKFSSVMSKLLEDIAKHVGSGCDRSCNDTGGSSGRGDVQISEEVSRLLNESGWRKFPYSGRDYWYKLFTAKQNFDGAESECARAGATLATEGMRISYIRNQVVSQFLRPGGHRAWIGLKEGSQGWFWIDGTASTENNTAWAEDEPNNPLEKCGDLLPHKNYLVNDGVCSVSEDFLCEKVF